MPWIWWCLERCWDCNCAGLSSTWTQCGVQRLSHDQENGRDMTWPISPLDQIFYEHGVKMGTLTATKKGPVTFPARTLGVDWPLGHIRRSLHSRCLALAQSQVGIGLSYLLYLFVVLYLIYSLHGRHQPKLDSNLFLWYGSWGNICVAPWICWTDAFTGFRWHLLTSLHCHLLGFGLDLLSPKEDSFALHETVLPRLALPAFLVNRKLLWQDQACLYAKTLDPCALSQIAVVSDEALL